jgi:hypothetical protein
MAAYHHYVPQCISSLKRILKGKRKRMPIVADIFKLVLVELLRTRSKEVEGWGPVLLCHDSILIEGPIESQEAARVWLQNAMVTGTNKLLKLTSIKPHEVEIKSGTNYGFTNS